MVLGSWRPVDLAGAGRLERPVRQHAASWAANTWQCAKASTKQRHGPRSIPLRADDLCRWNKRLAVTEDLNSERYSKPCIRIRGPFGLAAAMEVRRRYPLLPNV